MFWCLEVPDEGPLWQKLKTDEVGQIVSIVLFSSLVSFPLSLLLFNFLTQVKFYFLFYFIFTQMKNFKKIIARDH